MAKDQRGHTVKKSITIAHLYPREMNIYGDLGNIIALVKRLEWRGIEALVKSVEVGEPFNFEAADIVFGGGGQDSGQSIIGGDLINRGAELRHLAQAGTPMLAICGTYQLFGRGFTTSDGQEIPGIGVFGCTTRGSDERMIGNIVVESDWGTLVGFENHSGQTMLDDTQQPLGRVTKGFGNNTRSGYEGAVADNAIGSYMHGPLLPKNPKLADHLLLMALKRKYEVETLETIDGKYETSAARVASTRPQ
jgi:CobQ-like glutamine amidotransferase family enzyme